MPCFSPIKAFRLSDGSLVFDDVSAVRDVVGTQDIPCRRCTGCRMNYAAEWSMRFMHEASMHSENCVVTLTYDDEHLPYRGSIDYPEVQRFLKRLRFAFSGRKVRFAVGCEYGEQLGRPHYHAALFGLDFDDKQAHGKSASGTKLWTSAQLEKLWPLGHSLVGVLDQESAGYIARYCFKKVIGQDAQDHYQRVDQETGEAYWLQPECLRMSTRPGIGAAWLAKYRSDVYPGDHVVLRGGIEKKPPRYYDKLLKRQDPAALVDVQARREADAWDRRGDCTPQRLEVRETVAKARLAFKKRVL